ncbi:hypothetical protein ACFY0B_10380 [Streptomyces sp. NPDC001797]|uniref:hypothetical protein n=1 Tax=Streptomyces sp. NPDC001797 TaxID=3364610 RepID=UPI00369545E5
MSATDSEAAPDSSLSTNAARSAGARESGAFRRTRLTSFSRAASVRRRSVSF